jgi:hypothetical protein
MITRANVASLPMNLAIDGWAKASSRCETKPGTTTRSIGPSPAVE